MGYSSRNSHFFGIFKDRISPWNHENGFNITFCIEYYELYVCK